MAPTSLVEGDDAAAPDVNGTHPPAPDDEAAPSPPEPASKPPPDDETSTSHVQPQGVRDLVVPPGRLGLTLQLVHDHLGAMAVVRRIDPACPFAEDIAVGEGIVSVDGRPLRGMADLQANVDQARVVGIVPADGRTVPPPPSLAAVPAEARSIQDMTVGEIEAYLHRAKHMERTVRQLERPSPAPAGKRGAKGARRRRENDAAARRRWQREHDAKMKGELAQEKATKEPPEALAKNELEAPSPFSGKRRAEDTSSEGAPRKMAKIAVDAAPAAAVGATHFAGLPAPVQYATLARERAEFETWRRNWQLVVARYAEGWERRLKELERYQHQHRGECNMVPLEYRDPDDATLGEWVRKQRELYHNGTLDQDRIRSLKNLGFDFQFEHAPEVVTGDDHFDKKVRELGEYQREHATCDVPVEYHNEGETLGPWVQRMRERYIEGTLEKEKHLILIEKGFVFEPGTNVKHTIVSEGFMRNYRELVQFQRDHGHVNVPSDYRASRSSALLAKWLGKQKGRYKNKELSRNHIRLLEEIGLDLSKRKPGEGARTKQKWETKYNELVAFREVHGHCNVTQKLGNKALNAWVGGQRSRFREGKMAPDRARRLVAIGFNFDPLNKHGLDAEAIVPALNEDDSIFESAAWMSSYEALKSFVETNGHADVQPGYQGDNAEVCLHAWIGNQKRFFDEGKLPQQNVDMLEALGIVFGYDEFMTESNEDVWTKCYEALRQCKVDKGGSVYIPSGTEVDNGKGGQRDVASWLMKQKENRKRLTPERASLIEGLGINLNAKMKIIRKKPLTLGEMPEDDLWYQHEDGQWRRVPTDFKFPQLSFEEMYVLYHCPHENTNGTKMSPMKMFQPWDMKLQGAKSRNITYLSELKQLCEAVDGECVRKDVIVDGPMTEEEAKRCVRIGLPALNIVGSDDLVLRQSWAHIYRKKSLNKEADV